MKTLEEINKAKGVLCGDLKKNIDLSQRILLQGMLVALNWVSKDANGSTLDRLVDGEEIAEGQ